MWFGSTWIESESLWNYFRAQPFWKFCCLYGFPVGFHLCPADPGEEVAVVWYVRIWDRGHDGPCRFIPVRLSILRLDLVTSILIFKLQMGNYFWSLCCGPVACLRWTMVGWIVGSVQCAVSILSVFEILTDPHISVVGKKNLAGCSVPIIWFLVILLPSVVVICLDYAGRFFMQVRKSFAVPALIVFLTFFSIVFLA